MAAVVVTIVAVGLVVILQHRSVPAPADRLKALLAFRGLKNWTTSDLPMTAAAWVFDPAAPSDVTADDVADSATSVGPDPATSDQYTLARLTSADKAKRLANAMNFISCHEYIYFESTAAGLRPGLSPQEASVVFPECAPAGAPSAPTRADTPATSRTEPATTPTESAIAGQPAPTSPGAHTTAANLPPTASAEPSKTLPVGRWLPVDLPISPWDPAYQDSLSAVRVVAIRVRMDGDAPMVDVKLHNGAGQPVTVGVQADFDGPVTGATFGGPAGAAVAIPSRTTRTSTLPYLNNTGYAVPQFPDSYNTGQLTLSGYIGN